MEDALKEAKVALVKSKDDMAKYYNQRRTLSLDYQPRDRVYLDASDIHTTQPSRKLSHRRLGPFPVIRKVGNGAYCLHLPPSMSQLHPVFNVIKLTLALDDPVPGWRLRPLHFQRLLMEKRNSSWKKYWTAELLTGNCTT